MNTPTHIILGLTAFSKRDVPAITAGAFAGALLPDLSLYIMAGYALFVADISPDVVFDELYFSDAWVAVFRIDNSFILWGGLLALASWKKWPILIAVSGAALLHIALDFPLHHDDGRPHFWPLSNWVFESPISYWDRRQGANWVGPIETLLVLTGLVILWQRHQTWSFRVPLLIIASLQLYTTVIWLFIFSL